MSEHASVNRACLHCGRQGTRDFVELVNHEGHHFWACNNANACLRRYRRKQRTATR
jgi:hypothetical protein